MPSTDTLTYDQTPPRRPNLDDMHGGLLENVPGRTPGPDHPNALGMNQADKLVVALAAVTEGAKIEVRFSASTPSIYGVWSPRGQGAGLVAADFTVVDNGLGDTSITHTGGKLPAVQWSATARVIGDAGDTTINVEAITNGWRIRTRAAGALADKNFLLDVSGL